jgi:hypothetical protein
VTSIGSSAFRGCTGLTSITIPDEVTSIGASAFQGCTGLTSITVPSSVTVIGYGTFSGCNTLTELTLPFVGTTNSDFMDSSLPSLKKVTITEPCTVIPSGAFLYCPAITEINLPNSVKDIREQFKKGYLDLTSINVESENTNYSSENGVLFDKNKTTLICYPIRKTGSYIVPEGVKNIGEQAFSSCVLLTSVTIPVSVTDIGSRAFSECYSLVSVAIPESMKNIGDHAFFRCEGLTAITLPNGLESIGDRAFGYSGLTSVIIPGSVTSIGVATFTNCYNLASVIIQNGVESIGNDAFSSCALTSVIIPSSVTTIGYYAFEGCSFPSVTIPSSVTVIRGGAFSNCINLASVIIPNGLKIIENDVFSFCSSLSSVTIPSNVTAIGDRAFRNCTSLASVIISNGITSIGVEAFDNCPITSITIPSSVTTIGDGAFRNCTSLASVICLNSEPANLQYNYYESFENVNKKVCTLYVPAGSKTAYQEAYEWKEFLNIVELSDVLENSISILPYENGVQIMWQPNENAEGYKLLIYADETYFEPVCTFVFDAEGKLINTLKSGNATSIFTYTVENLSGGTTYYYTFETIGADDDVLATLSGQFTTTGIPTDIAVTQTALLQIYPNPVRSGETIYIAGVWGKAIVSLISLNGNLLRSEVFEPVSGEITFSIGEIPAGVYFVRIVMDKEVKTVKVIVSGF